MANKGDTQDIFSESFKELFDESVRPVLLEAGSGIIETDDSAIAYKDDPWTPPDVTENAMSCSYCQVSFSNVQQQREHYKLDWHRYNLKESLSLRLPITEEDFNLKNEYNDLSSISGSDSDEDDQENLDTFAMAQGKIFLQNRKGQVFSLYRNILLMDKKEDPSAVNFPERFRRSCGGHQQWMVLILGGGHFAGAVFTRLIPILHKTFHCYTVRAGQGGSQSSRDGKSGGSHPKSAGASLRRYNEQALIDHVRQILVTWRAEIKNSSLIFYRASGAYNRAVLFGGKEPLLNRADPRLRTIPFSTGRATYAEVIRVHIELTSVRVYDTLDDAISRFSIKKSPEKDTRRSKGRSSCIDRAKSRELVERPLPGTASIDDGPKSEDNTTTPPHPEEDTEEEEEFYLDNEDLIVSFEDLEVFGDSLSAEQRKRGPFKNRNRKSKAQKQKEKEEARRKQIIDIIVKGNSLLLEDILQERMSVFSNLSKDEVSKDFFNEVLDDRGNSYLHLAAMNEHEDLLNYLLANNADPCLKNNSQQTAYSCTTSKISREALKKFAKENPDKYNYNKAQIPLNALTEDQLAEKKRAQRKVKREKEKEKKKENHMKQKEEAEKDRFISLSDREKRALAAERRILNSQGKVIARCFLCGSDMAGKVPFEYLENRFCSIDCLKSHRMKNTVNL